MNGAETVSASATARCREVRHTSSPMPSAKRIFDATNFTSHAHAAPPVAMVSQCSGSPSMEMPWPSSVRPPEL